MFKLANKKTIKTDNFEVSYQGSKLDDGTTLITAALPRYKSSDEFEKDILSAIMEQYNKDERQRQYSVITKENATKSELTLEKIDSLAVGIHSDLSKILELNNYILQCVTVDAYMGRAYECIYANINTDYKLSYPVSEADKQSETFSRVKAEIKNFNQFIDINDLIRSAVAGTFLEGNYTTYLRLKDEGNGVVSAVVDHYPLEICYPSDYCIDKDSVLEFDLRVLKARLMKMYRKSKKTRKAIYFEKLQNEVKANYPDEVYDAYMNKEDFVKLDDRYTGIMKINDMDRKFGVSPFFKALKALVILDNIEKADVADSKARSKKIIFQKLRKELLGPTGTYKGFAETEYAHKSATAALNTNYCLYTGAPFVESLEYVIDKSTNDNTSDSVKIYTSKLLTALGISFADSELSSFSTANISVEQLMRTINCISEQLERIINKYYQIYLEAIGLPKDYAPTIKIIDTEMMEWSLRKEFANFAYSTLNVSRDTVFKLVGLDVEDEKQKRIEENKESLDNIFTPRITAFNRSKDGLTDDMSILSENGGNITGRPQDSDNTAKQEYDEVYSKEVR